MLKNRYKHYESKELLNKKRAAFSAVVRMVEKFFQQLYRGRGVQIYVF